METKFSIVIPAFNSVDLLNRALLSVEKLDYPAIQVETIVINSASEFDIQKIVEDFQKRMTVTYSELDVNNGPGVARDEGIKLATGDYVLFLDSDDELHADALRKLDSRIKSEENLPDVVMFDWCFGSGTEKSNQSRKDHVYFSSRCKRITSFARQNMDGSVIFGCYRLNFIRENDIRHPAGLHEDIYFLFLVYFYSSNFSYLADSLYIKHRANGSVTSRVSKEHIEGYLNAYTQIVNFLKTRLCSSCGKSHLRDSELGRITALVSRIREITRLEKNPVNRDALFDYLQFLDLNQGISVQSKLVGYPSWTNYGKIFSKYLNRDDWSSLADFVFSMEGKSWSCVDIHSSLFLAPDEIRTCCKRFFVDGEMRGDVKLDIDFNEGDVIPVDAITQSKSELWRAINLGDSTGCDGCPFMEFKSWGDPKETFSLNLISMEHHSVCNLRCSYCDPIFYGGKREQYAVSNLLEEFTVRKFFDSTKLVVWGGGEPLLDPNFDEMLGKVADSASQAQHRILSNALRHSSTVERLLVSKQGQLVTSVDAGTASKYLEVRGRSGFEKVLRNLKTYVAAAPQRVTIKYIFTDDNTEQEEVDAFCASVVENELLGAFFQISGNFKSEWLTDEMLEAAISLYLKLTVLGAYHVYLDEHIWQRWSESHTGTFDSLPKTILSVEEVLRISRPGRSEGIYFWGAGQLSSLLFKKDNFVERWNIKGVVDSLPERIGSNFFGFTIEPVESLVSKNEQIFLSGNQGMILMREMFDHLNLDPGRLVRDLLW